MRQYLLWTRPPPSIVHIPHMNIIAPHKVWKSFCQNFVLKYIVHSDILLDKYNNFVSTIVKQLCVEIMCIHSFYNCSVLKIRSNLASLVVVMDPLMEKVNLL